MTLEIDLNLPEEVWQRLQTAKEIVDQSVNSITNSAQQVGESLKETATTTSDKAINTVTASLEQSWQTAEQIKSTTSGAVTTAIASSASDWLTQHPGFFKLVQILAWAANHPIISLVILLIGLSLLGSIIKAIVRLIETASWSILQVPLKLIQAFIKISFLSLKKVGNFAIQTITDNKKTDNLQALLPVNYLTIYQDKQQRLAEISSRLEAIQKEQNELLQEAADLIGSDVIDVKVPEIKPLKTFESHLG
ncbi:hypothetical protein FNW02_24485 [Komarekiella sp. 'clone 1']|uniref:Uncharacterized protein n=1 Tax=Komarekiella delphini-convector SJRDD-AB1 TaxID=2593771 RepID=A0AA40VT72_9NOST|nr:hypothetical protein [Komarekiella delphini-convector]MBD6618897.1 hypothetical protein [Komarekiella delphini-convector SJRDD-AB1]